MSATSDRGRLLHDGVSTPASAWRTKLSNPSRRSLSTREMLSPWQRDIPKRGLHELHRGCEGAGGETVWRLGRCAFSVMDEFVSAPYLS